MAQRVLKIILPASEKKHAVEMLESEEKTIYWREEDSEDIFIVSALTEAGHSERIMDNFQRYYSSTSGFQIVVFPVEASVPRMDTQENGQSTKGTVTSSAVAPLRISREELYSDIVDSTKLSSTFIFMTILSTLVVSVGLQQNNVAVIIGAMVIAPFLGPNVALAFSTCIADRELGNDAVRTLTVGVVIAVILAALLGCVFGADTGIPEISSRTRVSVLDIVLALASGCAGVLAFTTGASSAVIGVMVAVALLPPLTVSGLLLGAGHFQDAAGALLLFSTNVICINLAGVATFVGQGVSPRIWWQADKAKRSTRTALLLWSLSLGLLLCMIFLLYIR
jgi:uncharacterized hydrophobic protein (TIGR00341 family)